MEVLAALRPPHCQQNIHSLSITREQVMPKIKINDKEYDTEKLPEAARVPLFHLQMIDAELLRLNGQIAIHKTARLAYERGLAEALVKMEQEASGAAAQVPVSDGSTV